MRQLAHYCRLPGWIEAVPFIDFGDPVNKAHISLSTDGALGDLALNVGRARINAPLDGRASESKRRGKSTCSDCVAFGCV